MGLHLWKSRWGVRFSTVVCFGCTLYKCNMAESCCSFCCVAVTLPLSPAAVWYSPCCCGVLFGVAVAVQAPLWPVYKLCPCRSSCPPPAAGHWVTFTPLTGLLSTLLFLPLDSSIFLTKLSHRSSTLFLLFIPLFPHDSFCLLVTESRCV